MELKVNEITQNEQTMYTFNIQAKHLRDIAYYNTRSEDEKKGIQRDFSERRGKEIASYIDNDDGVLPNSIIVNLELKKLGLKKDDVFIGGYFKYDKIIEHVKKKGLDLKQIAFVIDGQHRLRSFEYSAKKDFSLIVTAFIDLTLAEVAEMFVMINYHQKPVNKSIVFDLLGVSRDIPGFQDFFILHDVTKKLNEDLESPFYDSIKMIGLGKGMISVRSQHIIEF